MLGNSANGRDDVDDDYFGSESASHPSAPKGPVWLLEVPPDEGNQIARVGLADSRIHHPVEAVDGAWIQVRFHRTSGAQQLAHVGEVVVHEQIQFAHGKEGRWQGS